MRFVTMRRDYDRQDERGTTVAEFAMVALLFFTLIFGIIEFGRMLFTHNSLADATRRGARFAVLHKTVDEAAVKNFVVYGSNGTFDVLGNPTSPPVVAGLTTGMVEVTYAGENIPGAPNTFGSNLGTATVKIVGYSFNFTVPVIGRAIPMGDYVTTLSAESAGEIPDDISVPSPTPVSTPEPTPVSTPEPTPEPTPVAP